MNEIRILYLYPDILDLYGDIGNIKVLKYRAEKRNIKVYIDEYTIGDKIPDFSTYDIVFSGGGADNEQKILSDDLTKYVENIKSAIDEGVFFLLICGSYQLFGKYYKGVDGTIIPGLGIFDYYTEAIEDRNKRCIGNIIINSILNDKEIKVIGFENHGGQTFNAIDCFGTVLYGNGNKFGDLTEGFMKKNVIGTYFHRTITFKKS